MKIYNFENFGHNFLLPNRLILMGKRPHQADFHEGRIIFGRSDEKGDGKSVEKGDGKTDNPEADAEGTGDKSKTDAETGKDKESSGKEDLSKLRSDVEGGREKGYKKIIITEIEKKRFRNEMGKEIYGGDEELRENYRKAVREAIETMDRDKLYDFIKSHSDNLYNKGDYRQWNKDFKVLISPNLPKEYSDFKAGQNESQEAVYLVGGLQQYLLDEFDTDVFQATAKKQNPFINVDGRLGVYTISVMAAHWNKEFLPADTKNRTKLAYGGLGTEYSKNPRNSILYGDALTHLNTQLGIANLPNRPNSRTMVAEADTGDIESPAKNSMESIRNELLAENATDGAIYAFDSAYDADFIPVIREIIKELKDEGVFTRRSPEAWDKVHNRLINKNSSHFNQAYLDEYKQYEIDNPDTAPATTPAPVPGTPTKSKIAKKETTKKKAEKLPKEDFIRGLRARINREDFDFNLWTWDEEEHREEFANKIYDLCDKYKIPLTAAVLDDVIENLKIYSTDGKSVDYGRKVFRLTDTQTAAQEAQNKRLISYLGRGLREKYLKEELPEEDDELMTKDAFIAEMITELDANDVDFQSWGFEYNARESFAKDAYNKCDKSKIPTSMNTVRHMVDKLIYEYMVADNDIEYFSDTDNRTEIASNNKILDEVTEGIA